MQRRQIRVRYQDGVFHPLSPVIDIPDGVTLYLTISGASWEEDLTALLRDRVELDGGFDPDHLERDLKRAVENLREELPPDPR